MNTASRLEVCSWGSWWQLVMVTLDNLCWALRSPNLFHASKTCRDSPSCPGSPFTAHISEAPCFVTPNLHANCKSLSLSFCLGVIWSGTVLDPLWQLKSASQQALQGSVPIFKFQSLTPAWKKLHNVETNLWLFGAWAAPRGNQRLSSGWTLLPHVEKMFV